MIGILLALAGGSLVSVQNTWNANVKKKVNAAATTCLVLFLGFLASFIIGLIVEGPSLFSFQAEPWFWFSGLIAVGVVLCVTQAVEQLSPSYAISIVIVSQILFSFLWDTFGLFGLEAVPFTLKDGIAIVLILIGVLIFQLGGKKKKQTA